MAKYLITVPIVYILSSMPFKKCECHLYNFTNYYLTNRKTILFVNKLSYSWPSTAWQKKSVGIFEYILACMLKVFFDVF